MAERRAGLTRWQQLLRRELPRLDPSIAPPAAEDSLALRGRALKGLEDRLDGLMCAATVAVYCRSPDRFVVAGDVESGYILVPRLLGDRSGEG